MSQIRLTPSSVTSTAPMLKKQQANFAGALYQTEKPDTFNAIHFGRDPKDTLGEALLGAITDKNIDLLPGLIAQGANVNFQNDRKDTPLLEALRLKDDRAVNILLEAGADVNRPSDSYYSPLEYALENGQYSLARTLIELGADVNDVRRLEILSSPQELMPLILEKGLDIQKKDENGNSPLMRAAKRGNEAWVQKLIELGGDVNEINQGKKHNTGRDGYNMISYTPLLYAAEYGNAGALKELLKNGADINYTTPNGAWHPKAAVTIAARHGNLEAIKVLYPALDKTSEVVQQHIQEALHQAAYQGRTEVLDYLFSQGEGLTSEGKPKPKLLSNAIYAEQRSTAKATVKFLLDKGVDVNAPIGSDSSTPLMLAAGRVDVDIVKMLLDAGANVHAKNNKNQTALSIADDNAYTTNDYTVDRKKEIGNLLCEKGAKRGLLDPLKNTLKYYSPGAIFWRFWVKNGPRW